MLVILSHIFALIISQVKIILNKKMYIFNIINHAITNVDVFAITELNYTMGKPVIDAVKR